MPFLAVFDRFLPIFSGRGVQKNFWGSKFFFSNKSTQSRPKTTYFVVITHFGKLCLISPQNWKTHFYPFSPIIWIRAEYRGPKNLGDNALCLLCYQNPSIFWWFRPIRTKIHQKIISRNFFPLAPIWACTINLQTNFNTTR